MAKKRKQPTPTSVSKKAKIEKKSQVVLSASRKSDEAPQRRVKWTNKQRVLVFSSRGIDYRARHLMTDLRTLMPHAKADTKMDRKDKLFLINEISGMKNCNKCIYFEAKKKKDLYMWVSNTPKGPSAKFLVQNVHTMAELKMTGNCLKGSRPLLSFDESFDKEPHWALLKELFTQIFGTPNQHPKSQPFIDHVFTFSIADNRIWFRNFQILEEDGSLAEIGPRFVLNPIKMFEGSFGGPTLYSNDQYISPNQLRASQRRVSHKYIDRVAAKKSREERASTETFSFDPTDAVFQTRAETDEEED